MDVIKEGDIVRHTKYAQPLEVVKTWPAIRQAEVKPAKGPNEQHDYGNLSPYRKE